MKAMIGKDFLSIWKYCKNYIVMCAVFLAASVFMEEYSFLQMYPVIFMGMLCNTLIAYDERDHWDRQVLTMPVTPRQYVTAKYLVGVIMQGTVLVLSAGANAGQMLLKGEFNWEIFWTQISILLVLAAVAPSLTLPFIFKNGSEKGRMAYVIVIGSAMAMAAVGTMVLQKLDLMQTEMQIPGKPLVAVLVVLLYLGSWVLSVHWYEKREF